MKHANTQTYQVWFPGESAWELWFVDPRKGARLVDTCDDSKSLKFKRGFRRRILALPAGAQVPHCFGTSANSEQELRRSAEFWAERKGISDDLEGLGVQPVNGRPPNTKVRVDVPQEERIEVEFSERLYPDLIIPAASMLSIPENDMAVWTELERQVLAVDQDGGTIHYQELSGKKDVDRAGEVRKLAASLKQKGLMAHRAALHIWSEVNFNVYRSTLSIDVNAGFRTDPAKLHTTIGMRPKSYREVGRRLLTRRRKIQKTCAVSSMVGLVLIVLTGSYLFVSSQSNKHRQSIAKLTPETERIGLIKTQWEKMSPAIDRNASVLETWRSIFRMPSSPDVQVNRLLIGRNNVELSCLAHSPAAAFNFIDEMVKSSALATFSWDYTHPETLRNGTTLFVMKGFK